MRKLITLLAATAFMAAPVFADNSNDVLQQIPGQENATSQPMQLADSDPAGGPVSHAQSQKNAPEGTMTTSHTSGKSGYHKKCHKKCHKNCHRPHKKMKKHKAKRAAKPANADAAPADQAPADATPADSAPVQQ